MNNLLRRADGQDSQNNDLGKNNGNWILFEGRLFKKSQLSNLKQGKKEIYADYQGIPIVLAEYEYTDFAEWALEYLKQKLNGKQR